MSELGRIAFGVLADDVRVHPQRDRWVRVAEAFGDYVNRHARKEQCHRVDVA